MFRIAKWATPIVAFGLIMGLLYTRATAEDTKTEKDTGTVKGVVKDKDDKAVSGATIRIVMPMAHKEKGGGAAADEKKPVEKAAGDKPAKTPPIATGTTDADGKFSIADVPVGKYTVMAGSKGVGVAHENIEVKKGETTEVSLKLEPRAKK
jgi:hypothetical protein